MKNFRVIFVILSINLVYSQRTPAISYITQKTIKDIGGTVELKCIILHAAEFPVQWLKINKENKADSVVIGSKSIKHVKDPRISLQVLSYDSDTIAYLLQITNIQETNIGVYQCKVQLDGTKCISAEVELVVRQPPTISDNSTRSLVVMEGESVKIECYGGGYPLPRIWFRRANNAILQGGRSMHKGNVLEISNVTKEDRGIYYCCAENGVWPGARRRIAIEVLFAPIITVPQAYLGQALQYDVDLECHVEAYPQPSIIWLKDGLNISNNQHYSVHQSTTEDEVTDTTLRIITIESRQYGSYTCRASNILGITEIAINVEETIMPVCPPACDTDTESSSTKSTSARLSCLVSLFLLYVQFNFKFL